MNNSSNFTLSPANEAYINLLNKLMIKYAYIQCILVPIIIVGNVVLVVSILYNRHLRRDLLHLSIVSIAVVDLIVGLLISPLQADIGFKRQFLHGCAMRMLASVFESYVHMFVSMWTMVNMNTDHILKMSYIRTPFLTPLRRRVLFGVILALPWLAMLFVVLPVGYAYAGISKQYCEIYLQGSAKLLVTSLVYMVPAAIILIQVVVMTVIRVYRRNRATRIPATPITVDIPPPWILIAASAVTVLFIFLEQLVVIFKYFIDESSLHIWVAGMTFSDSKSAVLPFVWFFYSDIRASFCELFNKFPCRRTVDVSKSDFKVSYKEFSDEVPEPSENSI